MTADEETAYRVPIQDNLHVILESDEELTIKDTTNSALLLTEDSSDSDDEELMPHHGVFSI